ncbi:hypothetical protein, partial [Deinococcus alpinitundrae]|uniref:hypothetical protein n=1 Tax=Deinococcus alpinitundrae TaxID=468913 RepID=UPI00137A3824
ATFFELSSGEVRWEPTVSHPIILPSFTSAEINSLDRWGHNETDQHSSGHDVMVAGLSFWRVGLDLMHLVLSLSDPEFIWTAFLDQEALSMAAASTVGLIGRLVPPEVFQDLAGLRINQLRAGHLREIAQ